LPLVDAHLVPAALIHLSWGVDHPEYRETKSKSFDNFSSSSSSSASASSASGEDSMLISSEPSIGLYLSAFLLSSTDSKGKDSHDNVTYFPSGEMLAVPAVSGNTMSGVPDSTADTKSDGTEKPQGKENKPKWLKIGK
jgi:hypothetical protein